MLQNRVRLRRDQRGWTQGELAERIGVSRQTIRLVEEGKVVPSTLAALRLAEALGATVEELFIDLHDDFSQLALPGTPEIHVGDTVLLTAGRDKPVAHPFPMIAGSSVNPNLLGRVTGRQADGTLQVQTSPYRSPGYGVAIAGCDPALQLLANHLSSKPAPVVWRNADNGKAVELLRQGLVQMAAVHFGQGDDGDEWFGMVDSSIQRIHFARWQLGWVTAPGNPKGFCGAQSLASGVFRLVNRRQGSGTRQLLDRLLRDYGLKPEQVPGYAWVVDSHAEVTWAVRAGLADVGIANSAVARQFGLEFWPILTEECQLWIPQEAYGRWEVQEALKELSSGSFHWELEAFGDYDVSRTGHWV